VQEGDAMTTGAVARLAIDQAHSGLLEPSELLRQPGDPVRDVVQAWPSTVEEPTDRGVGSQRLEQLDRSHEGHAHALRFEDFRLGTFVACYEFEHGPIFVDGGNRHGYVVERSVGQMGWKRRRRLHEWACSISRDGSKRGRTKVAVRPDTPQGEPKWQVT